MGTKISNGRLIMRFPIILSTVAFPLLLAISFGNVFASTLTANDDTYTTNEDTPLIVTAPGVLDNDIDANGAEALLETAPASGSLELSASGALTYTPLLDFSGIITFSYYISKTGHISDVGDVAITVTAVNDNPELTTSAGSTVDEGAVVTITNSLLEATDVDNTAGELVYTLSTVPTNGLLQHNGLTLAPDDTFTQAAIDQNELTYSHDAGETVTDSFAFTVTDGLTGTIPTSIFAITINPINDAPVAVDDAKTTLEDTPAIIPVLINDSDVDGSLNPSTVTIITEPLSGTTAVNPTTGSITYTPTLNFNGNDSLIYQVYDNGVPSPALAVTATVYLTVTAVNDAPIAQPDTGSTTEDAALNVSTPGVLLNDSDVDVGDTRSVIGFDTTSSKGAAITVNAGGSYSYNPASSTILNALAVTQTTSDSFTYTIMDSGGLTDTATVTITVTGLNDAPTAVNDTATINEDNILTVSAPGVLLGDSDPDTSDTLTANSGSTTSSLGAIVTINTDGSYTYNPQNAPALQAINNGGTLLDTFTYNISDGHGGNDSGIVTVTVTGSNDAPIIDNSGNMTLANINEDDTTNSGTVVGNIITSVSGDRITDADAGALEGIAVVGVTNINGSWQYSLNGSSWTSFGSISDFNAVLLDTSEYIRFVPNADYNGTAGAISFRAWDQTSGSSGAVNINVTANGLTTAYSTAVETATLTVLNVNDAPVLDNSGAMALTNIGEDDTTNPGDSVAAIIASPGGNRITDVDPNAVEGIAVIGVNNANGVWQYSINGGLSWFNLNVSSTSATLLGSTSRIRFLPNPNYFGPAGNITFRAWDQTTGSIGSTNINISTNGGTTAFSTATETATLTVYSINDAPFLDLNGSGPGSTSYAATFTEDGGPIIIVDSDLYIQDVDDLNIDSAQAVLTNPLDGSAESLAVNVGGTGITAVYNPTNGILSLSGSRPLLNYQTVLRTLTYQNTSQNPQTTSRIVEITVNDGNLSSNLTTSIVTINAVNDLPILAKNITLPVNEGGDATISVNRLQVTDVDNTPSEIVYTIISPPIHGDLLLSGGALNTNDTLTQADINNNILDYSNDGSENTSDSFTFSVADSSGGTIGVTTFNISINADNDSPTLDINAGLNLDEGATSIIPSSKLTTNDVDNTAVELTYRLEIVPVNGNLLLNNVPLGTNDVFTQADINNNKLVYTHDGSETTNDSFTFAVEDGSGGIIDSTIFAITVNPVNDSPSVDLNGATTGLNYAATFIEDGGPTLIVENTLSVSDNDNVNLFTATATLVNRPDGTAESLSVSTSGTNITANYNPATGILSLTGIDTVNKYQDVLRSLRYNNTSQDPSVINRVVNVVVYDGAASSAVTSSTITVQAINDTPVLLNNRGLTIDYAKTVIINSTSLKITDVDNSASELIYTVTSLPTNGELTLNGNPLAANGTFTQANIDAGLLAYAHNRTNTESDAFQFTAVDGSGGVISQKTFSIVIHPQPKVYIPVILQNYVYGEPNNASCDAFGITFNQAYHFLPDDQEDWYRFNLSAAANIVVHISAYTPSDGQMLVYTGSNCSTVSQIGHKPNISPGGNLNLGTLTAGTYYIRIYTKTPPANPTPYTLLVEKP